MPTQEERITTLEQTTQEYRPILQNFAYELSMVKGLIIEQTGVTQELRRDVKDVQKRINAIEKRLDQLDTKFDEHTTLLTKQTALLTQILERLPDKT